MNTRLNHLVPFLSRKWNVLKGSLLVLVMLIGCIALKAQTIFPVQSTTRILPPYSVYLADYAVNGNNKLQCILVNRDATATTYNVRLRLTVKLNGRIIMHTSSSYNPQPIQLTPNSPLLFAGATLEPYLKSENLDFVGYNQDLYEQNRALPEGFYEIGFAAYDYYRQDVQVSNDGWGFYFLAKNEPPLLNTPACGAKLQAQYSTPIRFSWLPRNTASLNSSNTTKYRYYLYEVNPRGTNPNDIVNSLPPIYIDSTAVNQSYYDLMPTTTLFRDTFDYVWRVQAVDINGADMFRNNGFSEVCTFTWGGPGSSPFGSIDSVLNLQAIGETPRKGKMWWTKDVIKYDTYKVYYKKSGSGYSWFTSETANDTLRVFDLEPDTEYECRIQGKKNGSYGIYSDVRYFRTPKIIPVLCDDAGTVPVTTTGRPMINLLNGTTVTYHDFQVTIDQFTTSQPGWYAGKGTVSLPFLAGMVFAIEFDNIYIDDAGVISQGEIKFVSQDLQEWWKAKQKEQEGGNNVGDVKTGSDAADYTTSYNILSPNDIKPVLPVVNGITNIVIILPNGTTDTLKNVTLPYTIKDNDGDIYSVDKNGQVTKIGKSGGLPGLNMATLNNIDMSKAKVTFKAHPNQFYGFDVWQSIFAGKLIVADEYEKLTDAGLNSDYYVSNKAIGAARTDKVIAKIEITDAAYKADSVKFATAKGTLFTPVKTSTPGEYELTIIGGPAGDAQELYALYKKPDGSYMTLGKLKIAAYRERNRKIVIIPVNGYAINETVVKDKLNKMYGSVGVTYTVQKDAQFTSQAWDLNKDGEMDITGSGILSKYTSEMKQLNRVYEIGKQMEKGTSYIFLLNKANEDNVSGDMPRGSQFGYIFTDNFDGGGQKDEKIAEAIAHEIGHGMFNLKHLFDPAIGFSQNITDNLMDYGPGTKVALYKFQWDQIHDPGKVDGLFESDNSGLLTNGNLDDEHTHFDKKFKSPTVYFLTPGHTVFGVVDDEHFSEPGFYSRYRNKGIPRGVLINFWYHGLYYVAKYSNDFKTFLGYVAEGIQDNNLYLDDRDVIIPPDGTEVDVQMGDEGDGCIYSFYKIRPKISKDGMAGGTGQYGHIYSEETFNEAIYPRFGFEKSENQCVLCGSPNRSYLINNLIKAFGNMDLFGTFDGDAIHIIEEQLKKINDGVDIANEDFRTKICAEERYKIIKKLCIGFFTRTIGDDEKVVVKLIELTPDVQVIEFLNFLKNDDDGLLSSLEDKMHGDEYVQYHLALNSLYRKSEGLGVYAKINALDQYTETPEVHYRMNHRTFIWSDYRFIKRFVNLLDRSVVQINYDIDINDEGKIDVDIEIPSMMSARASTTIQDPFELVKVIFLTDAGSLGYNAGDSAYIPAINLLVLGNDQFKGEMIDLINVAFIIGSAGSGAAFSSVGGAFWTSISAVSLVISSYQASIGQSQEGRDFLAAWDVLNKALLVYQTYRIVTAIPSAISSVRSAFARFKVKNPSGAASVETELNQALTQAEQVAGNPEGLSGRIRNYSSLKTKFEQLEQIKKTEFLRDFVAASDELLNALDKEVELFEVWKKWGNKGVIELEELRAFQKVWKKSTRDVTFDNFYERTAYQMSKVAQLAKPGYNKFMPELYAAWEAKNVAEMENIFRKYGLDPLKIYPPCEGAWRFPQTRTPSINDQFDRFQYGETLYGSNASPVENGASYTISSRALIENYYFPTAEEAAKGYYYFKFRIKTTTAASFEYGEVMPWAGKQGGGMQVKSSVKFNDMLVTEEIEILEKFKYDVTSDTWIQIQ